MTHNSACFKLRDTVLICATVFIINACVNHDLDLPVSVDCTDSKAVKFDEDIRPIINTKCAIKGCHNGDNGNDINWTVLANFQKHANGVKRRVTLAPSDPDKMPRIGQLTLDQIQLIVCWVEQGALDN